MLAVLEKLKIPLAIVTGFVLLGLILDDSGPKLVPESGKPPLEEQAIEQREGEVKGETQSSSGRAKFIIDGDTFELESGERVRLIGIDTPERGVPFYAEAKTKLEELILGKALRLEKDVSETDRYGRLLRYVYVGDGFVNLELVRTGYAQAFTYPPDVKFSAQFLEAQQQARDEKLGWWDSSATPEASSPTQSAGYSLPSCASTDCDCGDFATFAEAQWFHENYNPGDKHRLDQDKDGLACETLP